MWTPGGQLDHLTFAGLRKGGGGSNPYEQTVLTDPVSGMSFTSSPWSIQHGGQSASDQLNAEIIQRKNKEQADSDAAAAQKKADADKQEADFQTKKSSAYNTALTDAMNTFKNQGLDPNQYMDTYIKPAVDRQMAGIADLDPNPMGDFPTDLGSTILGTATSDARAKALGTLNQTFNPNYANTALPDTLTQPLIQQILGEQFDPLVTQLQNAQKRGTLNPQGYAAAMDTLNQKKTAAQSQIQSLGANILSGDRSSLNDVISGARSDINNMNLGQNIDPNSYVSRAQGMVGTDISGLGGALRSAVGGTQFADITDLLNSGGASQGAGNPTAANPNALPGAGGQGTSGTTPDALLAQQKRGLGNTGAF